MLGIYDDEEFEEWIKEETKKSKEFDIQRKLMGISTSPEVELNKEDLFSLLHIAVDNKDKEYFDELVERLNKV